VRLPARVAKLEAVNRNSRVVIMWRHHRETDEQAKARWRAEHPGQELEGGGITVIIVGWGDPRGHCRVSAGQLVAAPLCRRGGCDGGVRCRYESLAAAGAKVYVPEANQ
jgi:hypothetical protein